MFTRALGGGGQLAETGPESGEAIGGRASASSYGQGTLRAKDDGAINCACRVVRLRRGRSSRRVGLGPRRRAEISSRPLRFGRVANIGAGAAASRRRGAPARRWEDERIRLVQERAETSRAFSIGECDESDRESKTSEVARRRRGGVAAASRRRRGAPAPLLFRFSSDASRGGAARLRMLWEPTYIHTGYGPVSRQEEKQMLAEADWSRRAYAEKLWSVHNETLRTYQYTPRKKFPELKTGPQIMFVGDSIARELCGAAAWMGFPHHYCIENYLKNDILSGDGLEDQMIAALQTHDTVVMHTSIHYLTRKNFDIYLKPQYVRGVDSP